MYFIGELNTLCSNRLAQTIATLSECQAAVHELKEYGYNLAFHAEEGTPRYPTGCYIIEDTHNVYYNTRKSGIANHNARPMCKTECKLRKIIPRVYM